MKKETIDYMLGVMQAYKDGKHIECCSLFTDKSNWMIVANPSWDWYDYTYRIKPEPKIDFYHTAEEVLKDMKEHGPMVKDGKTYRIVKKVTTMEDGSVRITLSGMKECGYELAMRKDLTWQDGTPFGIMSE